MKKILIVEDDEKLRDELEICLKKNEYEVIILEQFENVIEDILNKNVDLIIFLMASAAVLALKELSESSDNKERYRILRKIGTDEKMINKSLFCQIGIFFDLPLLIAIVHSIFGIIFSVKVLEIFGTSQLLPSIVTTALFIIVIYGGYFFITYMCSKNIIKER